MTVKAPNEPSSKKIRIILKSFDSRLADQAGIDIVEAENVMVSRWQDQLQCQSSLKGFVSIGPRILTKNHRINLKYGLTVGLLTFFNGRQIPLIRRRS
jgi:hypothetical protein